MHNELGNSKFRKCSPEERVPHIKDGHYVFSIRDKSNLVVTEVWKTPLRVLGEWNDLVIKPFGEHPSVNSGSIQSVKCSLPKWSTTFSVSPSDLLVFLLNQMTLQVGSRQDMHCICCIEIYGKHCDVATANRWWQQLSLRDYNQTSEVICY